MENPKSEIRNPKEVRNPKSEIRKKSEIGCPKRLWAFRQPPDCKRAMQPNPGRWPMTLGYDFGFRTSDFGFLSDFGFRAEIISLTSRITASPPWARMSIFTRPTASMESMSKWVVG